ncbi:MAG: hypothetical protein JSS09_04480 [Verrucomicrobia bacterium]|nr:hypothetical protein [Verrucomicrobiota bacterium]
MKFVLLYILGIIFHPLNADLHQEDRLEEIHSLKNHFFPLILQEQDKHPEFFQKLQTLLNEGEMHLAEEGNGGAYILKDGEGRAHFVIKPTDEDIYCLNNPKKYGSSSLDKRARENIPLYYSSPREAFCYELASLCELESITPKTHLSLLSHPAFFHLSPPKSEEKLCSVSEYVQEGIPLFFLLQNLFSLSLKDQDLEPYFDKEDFALINLFIWLTYDNDAHASNILAYPKEKNLDGFILYGLKKIDNSLSFPEKNTEFFHFLMHFPHARHPISSSIREKINTIPLKTLEKRLERFHLSSAFLAFKERVHVLQELAKRPTISYYEVSLRLLLLQESDGLTLALSPLSLEELEKFSPSFL